MDALLRLPHRRPHLHLPPCRHLCRHPYPGRHFHLGADPDASRRYQRADVPERRSSLQRPCKVRKVVSVEVHGGGGIWRVGPGAPAPSALHDCNLAHPRMPRWKSAAVPPTRLYHRHARCPTRRIAQALLLTARVGFLLSCTRRAGSSIDPVTSSAGGGAAMFAHSCISTTRNGGRLLILRHS